MSNAGYVPLIALKHRVFIGAETFICWHSTSIAQHPWHQSSANHALKMVQKHVSIVFVVMLSQATAF